MSAPRNHSPKFRQVPVNSADTFRPPSHGSTSSTAVQRPRPTPPVVSCPPATAVRPSRRSGGQTPPAPTSDNPAFSENYNPIENPSSEDSEAASPRSSPHLADTHDVAYPGTAEARPMPTPVDRAATASQRTARPPHLRPAQKTPRQEPAEHTRYPAARRPRHHSDPSVYPGAP